MLYLQHLVWCVIWFYMPIVYVPTACMRVQVATGDKLVKSAIYKLHGDMAQSDRTATFCKFCEVSVALAMYV